MLGSSDRGHGQRPEDVEHGNRAMRWRVLRVVRNPVLVAIITLGLVVSACASTGTGTTPATTATTTPSPSPTASASGRDWSHPLTAAELVAAIAQERQSADAWRDVVYAGGIDATRTPPPLSRECAELMPCTVIGTLIGLDDATGVVAVGHQEFSPDLPPPTTPADLAGPVALHIPRAGPIEFLGHVQPGSGALAWSVAAAADAIPVMVNGRVLAVDGWLTSVNTSCGPAPMPMNPPLPDPWNCQPPGWIGSDANAGPPKIDVQTFAYQEFATDPQGANNAPFPARPGVYLVRWVEYEAANCHDCRRFLVVGRLDASTPSPNDITNPPTIRSAQELAADLATDRPSLVDHVVFVDGQILPGRATEPCTATALCSIGTLVGTTEPVRATPYAVSLLLPDTDFPTHGLLSLVVRSEGLEYLGDLALNNGVDKSAIFPFSVLREENTTRGPLTVIAHGWLVDAAIPCPSAASPSEPPDTPFGPCATDWLTPSSEPVPQPTSGGTAFVPPTDGVRVQNGAYRTFGANPRGDPGVGDVPQEGTYLLRLAQDWPDHPGTQRGWQVVARLEP